MVLVAEHKKFKHQPLSSKLACQATKHHECTGYNSQSGRQLHTALLTAILLLGGSWTSLTVC